MMDIYDYKNVRYNFRRRANDLLKTEFANPDIPLHRFKSFIDTNDIIKNIVQNAIKDIEYDYNNCFITNTSSGWAALNFPIDENEQLKAIYDYMSYIVDNKIAVEKESMKYYCSSRKKTDIIQNFVSLTFMPMINYINDELSKLTITEEKIMGQTINVNNSVLNIANGGSSIVSNNTINISENDIKAISNLITTLKSEINKSHIFYDKKENVIDDLDIIQEQVEGSINKPERLKKAYNNVKSFLSFSVKATSKGVLIIGNIRQLLELLKPIIEKIG